VNSEEEIDELTKELENMEELKDDSEIEESASDKFKAFIMEKECTTKEIIDELTKLQKAEGFTNKTRFIILFESLFDKNIRAKLQFKIELIKQFINDTETQADLLSCIEKLCYDEQSVIKDVPFILQILYDNNVLEEDNIVSWYDTVSFIEVDQNITKQVRKAAEPFVTWLKTAEVESD